MTLHVPVPPFAPRRLWLYANLLSPMLQVYVGDGHGERIPIPSDRWIEIDSVAETLVGVVQIPLDVGHLWRRNATRLPGHVEAAVYHPSRIHPILFEGAADEYRPGQGRARRLFLEPIPSPPPPPI